jgi:hypothetical protein
MCFCPVGVVPGPYMQAVGVIRHKESLPIKAHDGYLIISLQGLNSGHLNCPNVPSVVPPVLAQFHI